MDLALTVLTSAATAALVLWIARSWVLDRLRTELAREREAIESKLRAEQASLLERVRADGRLDSARGRQRFQKALEAVTELATRWDAVTQSAAHLAGVTEAAVARERFRYHESLLRELDWFDDHFRTHRFFLPRELGERLAAAVDDLRARERELTLRLGGPEPVPLAEAHRAIADAFEAIEREARAAQALIEDHGRRLVGGRAARARQPQR